MAASFRLTINNDGTPSSFADILRVARLLRQPIRSAAISVAAYLPANRRRALAQGRSLPDRAQGTALFADISGFTPLTEALARALGPRLGAEELAHQLNLVYDALIAEVNRYGGSVVFFSGDSITCWFDE